MRKHSSIEYKKNHSKGKYLVDKYYLLSRKMKFSSCRTCFLEETGLLEYNGAAKWTSIATMIFFEPLKKLCLLEYNLPIFITEEQELNYFYIGEMNSPVRADHIKIPKEIDSMLRSQDPESAFLGIALLNEYVKDKY